MSNKKQLIRALKNCHAHEVRLVHSIFIAFLSVATFLLSFPFLMGFFGLLLLTNFIYRHFRRRKLDSDILHVLTYKDEVPKEVAQKLLK